METFQKAGAVWLPGEADYSNQYNQFAGFHTCISAPEGTKAAILVAARSCYRLYINGKMISNGPARTAENYCRVDRIEVVLGRENDIAIEVAAYAKPEKYSNDCTMEPGMLTVEIQDGTGNPEMGQRKRMLSGWRHLPALVCG